jgi:hypothetical protein
VELGKPGDKGHCAIAYQLMDSVGASHVRVDTDTKVISFSSRTTDTRYWYQMSDALVHFAQRWDRGESTRGRLPIIEIGPDQLIRAEPIRHATVSTKVRYARTPKQPVKKPGSKVMRRIEVQHV